MQSYKKWESRKLQKKVLQTLVLTSMAYVCIIGGDNSAWAQDYNSDQTLEVGNTGSVENWETYDNVIVNKITVKSFLMVLSCIWQVLINN